VEENRAVRPSDGWTVGQLKATPNPFKTQTLIRYQLSGPGMVRLAVYNVAGQVVKVLASEAKQAGAYQASWDGRNAKGKPATPGVYFVRLQNQGFSATQKVVLVR
jgi:flagellar hook assembly protein FlgD